MSERTGRGDVTEGRSRRIAYLILAHTAPKPARTRLGLGGNYGKGEVVFARKFDESSSGTPRQSESRKPVAGASRRRRSPRVRASGAIWNTSRATDHYAAQARRSNMGIFINQKDD
jgi:hypothetical protein